MTRLGLAVAVVLGLAAPAARAETRVEATMGFVLTTAMDEPDDPFEDRKDQDGGFLTGATVTTSAGPVARLGGAFHATLYSNGTEVYHLGGVAALAPSLSRHFRLVLAVEAGVASFHDLGEQQGGNIDVYDVTVTAGDTTALLPYLGARLGFERDLFATGRVAIGLWMHFRGDLGQEMHRLTRTRCSTDGACSTEDAEVTVGGLHAGLIVLTLSMRL